MIGSTLSHQRIMEKLGQRGRGEVYPGEDKNLSRQVAIKVLSGTVLAGPERLAASTEMICNTGGEDKSIPVFSGHCIHVMSGNSPGGMPTYQSRRHWL